MTEERRDLLVLNITDNVAVLKRAAEAGSRQRIGAEGVLEIGVPLEMGHKVAIAAIAEGKDVLKYGVPIGVATRDISPGDHVHLHNLASRYTVIRDWEAEE